MQASSVPPVPESVRPAWVPFIETKLSKNPSDHAAVHANVSVWDPAWTEVPISYHRETEMWINSMLQVVDTRNAVRSEHNNLPQFVSMPEEREGWGKAASIIANQVEREGISSNPPLAHHLRVSEDIEQATAFVSGEDAQHTEAMWHEVLQRMGTEEFATARDARSEGTAFRIAASSKQGPSLQNTLASSPGAFQSEQPYQ